MNLIPLQYNIVNAVNAVQQRGHYTRVSAHQVVLWNYLMSHAIELVEEQQERDVHRRAAAQPKSKPSRKSRENRGVLSRVSLLICISIELTIYYLAPDGTQVKALQFSEILGSWVAKGNKNTLEKALQFSVILGIWAAKGNINTLEKALQFSWLRVTKIPLEKLFSFR